MMDFSLYDAMTLEELRAAGVDVFRNIQNEKIWIFGSAGDAEAECMHAANVDRLRMELKYILGLIERRELHEAVD